jgi:hypothetical protein
MRLEDIDDVASRTANLLNDANESIKRMIGA